MNRLLVTLTDDDQGNREDCNVFYSDCYLIEHDRLCFQEPIFIEKEVKSMTKEKWLETVKSLGYNIPEIPHYVICLDQYAEDDEDDDC